MKDKLASYNKHIILDVTENMSNAQQDFRLLRICCDAENLAQI